MSTKHTHVCFRLEHHHLDVWKCLLCGYSFYKMCYLSFMGRSLNKGNRMRCAESRFICKEGGKKALQSTQAFWSMGSFQLPTPWPLEMYDAPTWGKPQWFPLGFTKIKWNFSANPQCTLSVHMGWFTWLFKGSQAAPWRLQWTACLGLPSPTHDMTSRWRARISLKCNNINYQVTLKHVWCMCAFISQEWYRD